jgi:hypothetical protein
VDISGVFGDGARLKECRRRSPTTGEARVVSQRIVLDFSAELAQFGYDVLSAHPREIDTRQGTRRLGCYRQALFGLAWLRDKSSPSLAGLRDQPEQLAPMPQAPSASVPPSPAT